MLIVGSYCSSQSQDSSFEEFVARFSSDKGFQLERIKFPIEITFHENFPEAIIHKKLMPTEWEHVEFLPDSITTKLGFEAFESYTTHPSSRETIIQWTGLDNGINVSYHFRIFNRKWYLIEVINLST